MNEFWWLRPKKLDWWGRRVHRRRFLAVTSPALPNDYRCSHVTKSPWLLGVEKRTDVIARPARTDPRCNEKIGSATGWLAYSPPSRHREFPFARLPDPSHRRTAARGCLGSPPSNPRPYSIARKLVILPVPIATDSRVFGDSAHSAVDIAFPHRPPTPSPAPY